MNKNIPSHHNTQGRQQKIRVLVADDHSLFREGLCKLLEGIEDMCCIAVADDGEQAINMVKEHSPDVVLMDISMPKVDGIEATRKIKQNNPKTSVIILSAYKDDNYVLACLENGVNGYLLKDIHRTDLINAIRIVSSGELVFNLEVARRFMHNSRSCDYPGRPSIEKPNFNGLHDREFQILRLAAKGMSNKEIALKLSISVQTVGTHFVNIFRKLDVGSRVEAIIYALKQHWFTIDELPDDEGN